MNSSEYSDGTKYYAEGKHEQNDDSKISAEEYDESKKPESSKPSSKSNKMSALSRIKAIQENDWKTWRGVNTKRSGRPGTAGIVKAKTKKDPDQSEVNDDNR